MKNQPENKNNAQPFAGKRKAYLALGAVAAILVIGIIAAFVLLKGNHEVRAYQEKSEILKAETLTQIVKWELGDAPAGAVGHAVFLSVCDGEQRASVFSGTGADLDDAWENANKRAESAIKKDKLAPDWVKADVVYISETVDTATLNQAIANSRSEFLRYGIAFDGDYRTALLEAELNGYKIYDYENGTINLDYLNRYLKKAGRDQVSALPETYTVFRTFSRFCDEENRVYHLDADGLDYGRRTTELIDAAYAEELIATASDYLAGQIKEDGSFVYGYYPRFDNKIENYNMLRHAGTVWSLVCRYRMTEDPELAETIELAIDYMLNQLVYRDENTAYLYEAKADEIKLGGCGIAIVALTEYMEAFESDKYLDVCRKMGNGILSLMDRTDGTYYHVLNGDFSQKEEFRTVYYDGEATFALCRLYGVTGDQVWLDAAKSAVGHFIAADYVQHRDQWVAYSMNEITKYVDDPGYYAFALRNVQENYDKINRETTAPVTFELLLATFELYDRLIQKGAAIGGFNHEEFMKTIYARADRMLDGYFYPEYAMYMENPGRILGAFMVREDGYRTRIDDVQHCIGGYYLYQKNYDKLVSYGILEYRN